jgi:ABC-type multidrug transport system fused ATPase/permease subunit
MLLTHTKLLLRILSYRERRLALLVLSLNLLSAACDTLGVASILPFLTVAAQPERIHQTQVLAILYHQFSFVSERDFLLALAGISLLMMILSVLLRAVATYVQLRFVFMTEYSISTRLFRLYLSQTYVWFLKRHSAELNKMLLSEVSQVMQGVAMPLFQLCTSASLALGMLTLGLWIEPKLTLGLAITLGLAYFTAYKISNHHLSNLAEQRFQANQNRFKVVSETFGALKDIKATGQELSFLMSYDLHAGRYAARYVQSQVVAQAPRFVMEAMLFGGMLIVLMYFLNYNRSLVEIIPNLAVLAFAGYRLIPAIQMFFGSFVNLRFQANSLVALHGEIAGLQHPINQIPAPDKNAKSINLRHKLELKNLYFCYPDAQTSTLRGLTLQIRAGTTVAFVGSTGSGKTTLMDLIIGLLTPDQGEILVDGTPLNAGNASAWRAQLGYVSQQVFLLDDTVAENIAMVGNNQIIDREAVERAARMALLDDFVSRELPLKYDTYVGERGVRLSGGQRQRIGIARALYRQSALLVLDESTSALDTETERELMQTIDRLRGSTTILMVAHRMSTVRHCDSVVLIEDGKVRAEGTFEELLKTSSLFRKLNGLNATLV